jgi:Domain of unknown function (DUF2017)
VGDDATGSLNVGDDAVFSPVPGGGVEVHLHDSIRGLLGRLCDQLEELLQREHPASDPAMARLFPAAYPDDPLRELEFERMTGDDLTRGRLASLRTVRASLQTETLDEARSLAWLGTLNDMRLVLGSRLDVTEESTAADFTSEDDAGTFEIYQLLGGLQGQLLYALDPAIEEPEV